MTEHDWDGLLRRMEFIRKPNPRPSREACAEFERRTGLVDLPQSYLEYCDRLGPGFFSPTFVEVACPGYPALGTRGDLIQLHEQFRDRFDHDDRLLEGDLVPEDVELYSDLIAFGCEQGYVYFAWNPNEIRDAAGPEFSIYAVMRNFEMIRVADSFFMFIDEFCCGERANLIYSPPDEECPYTFEPLLY